MKKIRKALCDKFATLNDKFNNFKTRLTLVLLTGILSGLRAAAAGNGMAGINEATSMVSSYFDPGTKLIYAIGAVVGLIGGVKVYGKFVRREVA